MTLAQSAVEKSKVLYDKNTLRRALWKNRPSQYFEDCLKIEHKGCLKKDCPCKTSMGRLAPFVLNRHQQKMQGAIDAQRRAGKPVRLIVLKPRQTGISSCSSANLFHSVRFSGGTGMVVSMDGDSTDHIFGITSKFHVNLPEREAKILTTESDSSSRLTFAPPHGGQIIVQTAGKRHGGHSFTVRWLLLSEVPRWPEEAEDTIVGLMNAVPDEPETMVVIEGVANGCSGWFYEQWHKTDSDYAKVFLPWYEHEEYQKPLPIPREKYHAQLSVEEKQLIARYSLSLEQVEFRRWCIREKCKGDVRIFQEQYPSNPQEAFRAAGNSFFDTAALDAIETVEPLRGYLKEYEDLAGKKDIRFVQSPTGDLRLWKRPQKGHSYLAGADIAEGLEKEGEPAGEQNDNSSSDVLDRNTAEQVAQLHGKLTPDEFARQLAMLGKWYNHAYLAFENNGGYGGHVADTLLNDEKYPQHLVYKDRKGKWGWCTDRTNKKTICSDLDEGVRRKELILVSAETVKEMRSFIKKPDGRLEGGNKTKDDRVMSMSIANKMLELAPPMSLRTEEQSKESSPVVNIPFGRSLFREPRVNA